MKKIEEAARKFYDENCLPQYDPPDPFIAGARYVLDQLTSYESTMVFGAVVRKGGPFFEIGEALAAVRKEIEGE